MEIHKNFQFIYKYRILNYHSMRKHLDLKNKSGMSFIEIIVVIIILMMLILTSYLVVPRQLMKARDASRKADLLKLRTALEEYYDSQQHFPDKLPECGQPFILGETTLINSLPCDPITHQAYYYETKKGEDTSYYRLYTLLENDQDISIDFAKCRGGCGMDCNYNYGISSTNVSLVRCSYVCAPGGGKTGSCELYHNPDISLCPKYYYQDSTCNNECSMPDYKCQNASGKNIPY
jgi:general secretion pathway protein G